MGMRKLWKSLVYRAGSIDDWQPHLPCSEVLSMYLCRCWAVFHTLLLTNEFFKDTKASPFLGDAGFFLWRTLMNFLRITLPSKTSISPSFLPRVRSASWSHKSPQLPLCFPSQAFPLIFAWLILLDDCFSESSGLTQEIIWILCNTGSKSVGEGEKSSHLLISLYSISFSTSIPIPTSSPYVFPGLLQ